MKLVLNTWLLLLLEALAETLTFAEGAGFEPQVLLDTVSGGPLDFPYAQLKGRLMIAHDYPPAFPLRLALKDARLVHEAAETFGLELPGVEAAAEELALALEAGHGDEDMAAVHEAVQARLARAAAR
jgi:3-hydroxyisobutyrate dehydrogenase